VKNKSKENKNEKENKRKTKSTFYDFDNAWSFSSIASIVLSKGFSGETLTRVGLCHKRPSWIKISYYNTLEHCYKTRV